MPETTKQNVLVKENEQRLLTIASGGRPNPNLKFKASTLADSSTDWIKLLMLGATGSGKTFGLAGILETLNRTGRPTKIFVASTDIGGNGLRSVKTELMARDRMDLAENMAWFEFPTFETFNKFTLDPGRVEVTTVDGRVMGLWEFDPDVLCWEGMSNFQESLVWQYVMDLDPINSNKDGKETAESREAGVQAFQPEWGQIRRLTILAVDRFLSLHNPNGKKLHKYATCLLDSGKEDKLTGESKRGPLLMTGARDYVTPAFDGIITCSAVTKPGTKMPIYRYTCQPAGSNVAKTRGLPIPTEAEADMKTLWSKLTIPATRKEAA